MQAFGYGNKEYGDALKAQIDKIMHTSNLYYNVPIIHAAERVKKRAGWIVCSYQQWYRGNRRCNQGSKKYAYTRDGHAGHEIIAMNHSFHGRSIGALSVTGNKHYQEPFEPLMPGVKFADYNDLDSVKNGSRTRHARSCLRQYRARAVFIRQQKNLWKVSGNSAMSMIFF